MKDVVIIGSGGLAKEVCWLIDKINSVEKKWNILGFVSKEKVGTKVYNYSILGDDGWFEKNTERLSVVCAIGEGKIRRKIIEKYSQHKELDFPNIIANDIILDRCNRVGKGCIIFPNTVLTVDIVLNDFIIINYGCTIGHDTKIDSYTTINPGAHVSGNVKINEGVTVGVGANILQGLEIGNNSIVGGGATVIRSIPSNSIAVGVPAKIRENSK